ncbi:MAG: MATE family efflux transporter [Syntrophomonadaceae bacterium]|nr:MATE family efflux transporter [Syntrophomonadaceae bacterium]
MILVKDPLLRKNIIKISAPAMAEMSLYMLIGVVDIAIVGRLGASELAAVGLGAEIFFALVLLFEAIAIGATVLAAQAKGANDTARVITIGTNTIFLALLLGIIPFIIGLIGVDALLGIFTLEPLVYQEAKKYLLITFKFAPIAVFVYMINSYFRGLGRTDIPMYVALVINIVNIIGDYVLVYGKLGFPMLGVSGAAWATSLAHIVGFVVILIILLGYVYKLDSRNNIIISCALLKSILKLGLPSFAEHFFSVLSNFTSIFLIVYIGTVAYASHQVALTVESISYMPGFGMAIAATALVGHAFGARDKTTLQKSARGTIEAALILMGIFGVLFLAFPFFIAKIFTTDPQVIKVAGTLIQIASLEQLTIASSMVLGGILKGIGDTKTPMLISIIFTWGFRLPLMYLFIIVLSLPVTYVWIIFITDWLLRTITFTIIYKKKIAALKLA